MSNYSMIIWNVEIASISQERTDLQSTVECFGSKVKTKSEPFGNFVDKKEKRVQSFNKPLSKLNCSSFPFIKVKAITHGESIFAIKLLNSSKVFVEG